MSLRRNLIGSSALVLLLVTGCATTGKEKPAETAAAPAPAPAKAEAAPPAETAKADNGGEETIASITAASPGRRAADIENQTIDEIIRIEEPNTQNLYDNSRYDFPITMNSRVEGWIDYFTGKGRPHMERYLSRSSRYIPAMKDILKRSGLPQDLVYLALIESGFNLRAKSRTRAVGPWQFMKATGKRYGLRVDAWIDERRDPVRSTEAAARYLKDLYLMFESWYLAASAYNAGEYKILRAIEELKTNNYWRICETRVLRRETKDYIPKLVAAAIIAKNPGRYGFDKLDYEEPLEFDVVNVDFPIKLAEIAHLVDVAEDDVNDLNPELMRHQVPSGVGPYEVRVPTGKRVLVERALAGLRDKALAEEQPKQHPVRSGETLASIARKYRLTTKQLANANNLSPKEKLTPGLKLIIPGRSELRVAAASEPPARSRRGVSAKESNEPPPKGFITHVVKSGESLWSISEKYDCTVQNLFKWNNLHRSRIYPGKRLKVKAPNQEAATEGRVTPKTKSPKVAYYKAKPKRGGSKVYRP